MYHTDHEVNDNQTIEGQVCVADAYKNHSCTGEKSVTAPLRHYVVDAGNQNPNPPGTPTVTWTVKPTGQNQTAHITWSGTRDVIVISRTS